MPHIPSTRTYLTCISILVSKSSTLLPVKVLNATVPEVRGEMSENLSVHNTVVCLPEPRISLLRGRLGNGQKGYIYIYIFLYTFTKQQNIPVITATTDIEIGQMHI